jgi:hypothetical protein
VVVFWNGLGGDAARNAPVGVVAQDGQAFAYWLVNGQTGELSQSPLYPSFAAEVSQRDLSYTRVLLPQGATPETFSAMWNGEAIFVQVATQGGDTEVLNLTSSVGAFEQIDLTELATAESINIFDANTFPGQYKEIATNWLTATDAEWQQYQEFVEAARANFFEKEGIADEVAAIPGINEELRSLWGVIYWVQNNRDEVIANQIMPVVTPYELRTILEKEPMFLSWVGKEDVNGQKKNFRYGLSSFAAGDKDSPYHYSSQNYGSILGREDFQAGRVPTLGVGGSDLVLMSRLFPDDTNTLVTILSMKTPPDGGITQTHVLYAQAIVLGRDYTLPAGTLCKAARAGEVYHAQPLPVDYHIRPMGSVEDIFNFLGFNLQFYHGDIDIDGAGFNVDACLHPETGLEIVTGIADYTINKGRAPTFLPWQQQQ